MHITGFFVECVASKAAPFLCLHGALVVRLLISTFTRLTFRCSICPRLSASSLWNRKTCFSSTFDRLKTMLTMTVVSCKGHQRRSWAFGIAPRHSTREKRDAANLSAKAIQCRWSYDWNMLHCFHAPPEPIQDKPLTLSRSNDFMPPTLSVIRVTYC